MKKIGLFIIVFLLYNSVVFYLGWNVHSFLHNVVSIQAPIVFYSLWWIFAYSMLIGMISHTFDAFKVIGYYWYGFLQYGLLIFPIANLLIWLLPESASMPIQFIVFALFVFIIIYGTYNAYSPVIREQEITIKNDYRAGESMKIVVASDFHLGLVMPKKQLAKFVRLSNAQKPDVVLLAGDLIDDVPYWYIKKNMKETMAALQATDGVYGILGNHEYYGKQIEETLEQMEQSGVTMLLDETIEVADKFILTGREDLTNKQRKSLKELRATNENLPWLLMDHTPKSLTEAVEAGVDFQVSGHTHLGQLWPNQLITRRLFDLDYGYTEQQALHAITSSGFGFWGPPLRTNSRAELWVVSIKFTEM